MQERNSEWEEIKDQLLEILEGLHPDEDFEHGRALVDDRVLDSFDIITLISEIDARFDVVISADKIIAKNFNSADALTDLVQSLLDED